MEYYKAARWFSPYHTLLVLPKLGILLLSVFFQVHLFSATKDSLVLNVGSAELENL